MLSMTKIDEAPLYVALSEENALAKLTQLSLRNLGHENWIIFGRPVHPPLYDTIFRAAYTTSWFRKRHTNLLLRRTE